MVDFAKVEIGGTGEFLDGVKVTTPAGVDLFRETQVAADPTEAEALARVKNEAPAVDDYGLVVRVAGEVFTPPVEFPSEYPLPASQVQAMTTEHGVWGYTSGVQGTATIPVGARVLQLSAVAGASGATMTINGGDTVTIPALASITIEPKGNLTAPSLVFTSTTGYFVEYVS